MRETMVRTTGRFDEPGPPTGEGAAGPPPRRCVGEHQGDATFVAVAVEPGRRGPAEGATTYGRIDPRPCPYGDGADRRSIWWVRVDRRPARRRQPATSRERSS